MDLQVDTSFIHGFATASGIGFIIFVIRIWLRSVTAPFRPQVVVHTTGQTPWQVLANSVVTFAIGLVAMAILLTLISRGQLSIPVP